jgi:hypothetical protein
MYFNHDDIRGEIDDEHSIRKIWTKVDVIWSFTVSNSLRGTHGYKSTGLCGDMYAIALRNIRDSLCCVLRISRWREGIYVPQYADYLVLLVP